MRVGVDIDGVLINSAAMWYEAGMKFAKENNIIVNPNPNEFLTPAMFKWSDKIDKTFWMGFYEDYYRFSLPIPKAVEALKKLKNEGHEIYLITARGILDFEKNDIGIDKIRQMTLDWLSNNEIPYDKIIFSETLSKSKICLENNVDVMVDDSSQNIKDVSCVLPVVAFARPYNEDIKDINFSNYKIYRTDDWNLIYTIINFRLQK